MRQILPSRKYAPRLVAIILVVAGVLWWSGRDAKDVAVTPAASQPDPLMTGTLQNQLNGDGLSPFFTLEQLKIPGIVDNPKFFEEATNEKDARTAYDLVDLDIVDDERRERLYQYGMEVASALAAFTAPSNEEGLSAVLDAIETGADTGLTALGDDITIHEVTVEMLLSIRVPGSAAADHLRLLRSIAHRAQLLRLMQIAPEDPATALLAADAYLLETSDLMGHLEGINSYFDEKKITFAKEDRVTLFVTSFE